MRFYNLTNNVASTSNTYATSYPKYGKDAFGDNLGLIHKLLKDGTQNKHNLTDPKDIVYVTIFSFAEKKNKKTLTYKYIKYPVILLPILLSYYSVLTQQCYSSQANNTGCEYMAVFDKGLIKLDPTHIQVLISKLYYVKGTVLDTPLERCKNCASYRPLILTHAEVGVLLNLCMNKDMTEIYSFLINQSANYGYDVRHNGQFHHDKKYSKSLMVEKDLLQNLVLVVQDLPSLIKYIKEDIDPSVNEGLQKYRGQLTAMEMSLWSLDNDFNNYIYDNLKVVYDNERFPHHLRLKRSQFTYNNIHKRNRFNV